MWRKPRKFDRGCPSMKDDKVSGVWAQALLEIAASAGRLDKVADGAATAASALSADPAFEIFLSSPSIAPERKIDALATALGGNVDEILLDFCALMTSRGRGGFIVDALAKFKDLHDSAAARAKAVVITAVPLDQETSARIVRRLEAFFKRELSIETCVDPGVIGGFMAQVGDKRIDSTALRDLKELRSRMLATKL